MWTGFSNSFPRNLAGQMEKKPRASLTDFCRRRQWSRACVPQGSAANAQLKAALAEVLAAASERSVLVTIHNQTTFSMLLVTTPACKRSDFSLYSV